MDELVKKVLEKIAEDKQKPQEQDIDKLATEIVGKIEKMAEDELLEKVASEVIESYLADYQINKLAEEMVDSYLAKMADVEEEAADAKVPGRVAKALQGYLSALKGEGIKPAFEARKAAKATAAKIHNPDVKAPGKEATRELLKRLGLTSAAWGGTVGIPAAAGVAAGRASKKD